MKKKMKIATLLTMFALFFLPARADVNMTLYVYYDCGACQGAIEYINTHLKYEYPMLRVTEIDMNAPTAEQVAVFDTVIEKCWLESRGLPIFYVNGKCVQGYGPIEESHPDLRFLIEGALSDKDKEIVAGTRAELAADADAFRARVDARAAELAAKATEDPHCGVSMYLYAVIAAVIVLTGLGLWIGRRRRK